jgi:hypothetical protein
LFDGNEVLVQFALLPNIGAVTNFLDYFRGNLLIHGIFLSTVFVRHICHAYFFTYKSNLPAPHEQYDGYVDRTNG